jgi:hypothetical protein
LAFNGGRADEHVVLSASRRRIGHREAQYTLNTSLPEGEVTKGYHSDAERIALDRHR